MMSSAPSLSGHWQFGTFVLDLEGRQLLESGNPVHISEQSLRLLAFLVERAGQVVSRRELQAALWPQAAVSAAEVNLNTAVRRLRQCLGDDNVEPRFIATIPGAGYRFVAAVQRLDAQPEPPRHRGSWRVAAAVAVAVVLAAAWLLPLLRRPRVLRMRMLTNTAGTDFDVEPATDGRGIFFLERAGDHWDLLRTNAEGGASRVAMPLANARVFDVARDRDEWLLGSFAFRGAPYTLWRMSGGDGTPVRVGDVQADDALWYPRARRIIYSRANALWSVNDDGSDRRQLIQTGGRATWLAWSPDARRLRYTVGDGGTARLWEWRIGAPAARRLGSEAGQCCGAWTGDGRYFLYSERRDNTWNLWALRDHPVWTGSLLPTWPTQLTAEPTSVFGAFTGGSNDQVVFYVSATNQEVDRLDPGTHQLTNLMPGVSAYQFNYGPGGRRVAWVDTATQSLWIADVDGQGKAEQVRRLIDGEGGHEVAFPRWSPDGRWIAYDEDTPGEPHRSYVIAADGGAPQPLTLPADLAGADIRTPDWAPDGRRLVVSVESQGRTSSDSLAIGGRDGQPLQPLAGSAGMVAARWSPDGRRLAAFSADQHRIEVYDFEHPHWSVLATGTALTVPEWSADGRYVYYQDLLAPGEPLFRVSPATGAIQKQVDFAAEIAAGVHRCGFLGLMPNGAPIIAISRSFTDLRAAILDLP